MAVVAEAYVEQFDRNFSEIKDEIYEMFPKEYTSFMRVQQTPKAFIKVGSLGGLGIPLQNRDLQPIPFQEPVKGPSALFTPIGYRLGYQIEKQTIEQEEWGLLASRPRTMLYGANILMEMVAANILNNGFTLQAYDMADTATGQPAPLFSTTHMREDGQATWSNLVPMNIPITVETVFNMIVSLLYNMVDSRGLPIAYSGKITLFVPSINPVLWQQAVEVIKSTQNPNTSDNKINALMTSFSLDLKPLRFATNPNHWFIAWDVNTPNYGLLMVVNIYPDVSPLKEFGNNPDAWYSRLRMRFTAGYENKRGIAAAGA